MTSFQKYMLRGMLILIRMQLSPRDPDEAEKYMVELRAEYTAYMNQLTNVLNGTIKL